MWMRGICILLLLDEHRESPQKSVSQEWKRRLETIDHHTLLKFYNVFWMGIMDLRVMKCTHQHIKENVYYFQDKYIHK